MRLILRWTYGRSTSSAAVRLARFRQVLHAAQGTERYQPVLRRVGLATPEALARVNSVESTLERLPAIGLEEFRDSPGAFESPQASSPALQPFQSPLEHRPRTAILMPGFEQTSREKVISSNWSRKKLKRFGATALAAPVALLRQLASAIESGQQEMRPLEHFVVPFTGGEHGELEEEALDRFWRVFQVPVFEQRVGFDGQVIAYECEAHHGLHLLPEQAAVEETAHKELLLTSLTDLRHPTLRIATRMAGSIQHECCDCGNAAARLVGLRAMPVVKALAAAGAY